jgi:hypothetical protein
LSHIRECSIDELISIYNQKMHELLQECVSHAVNPINTYVALTKIAGFNPPLLASHAERFIAFCKKDSIDIPLVELGLIPKPAALDFDIACGRYKDGILRKPKNVTETKYSVPVKMVPIDSRKCKIYSVDCLEWSAIQLKDNGIYLFDCKSLGVAIPGVGDTRKLRLVANWRITYGDDIHPKDKDGYSKAGQNVCRVNGVYNHVMREALSLDQPMVLIVNDNIITLIQNKKIYWSHDRQGHPVLFAFKNMWVTLTYNPDLSASLPSLPVDPSKLAAHETPMAAMQRLREMHPNQ